MDDLFWNQSLQFFLFFCRLCKLYLHLCLAFFCWSCMQLGFCSALFLAVYDRILRSIHIGSALRTDSAQIDGIFIYTDICNIISAFFIGLYYFIIFFRWWDPDLIHWKYLISCCILNAVCISRLSVYKIFSDKSDGTRLFSTAALDRMCISRL